MHSNQKSTTTPSSSNAERRITGQDQNAANATTGRASFFQDGLRLISNQILVTATNFASGVILSRALGPQGRGIMAAVSVYPTVFLNLAQMGVRAATVFYLGRRLFSDTQVVGAITGLLLIMGTVGILACGAALRATNNPEFTTTIISLAVLSIPLTLVEYYSTGVFLGKHLVGQLIRVERLAVLVKFLLVVLLVRLLHLAVPGALLASLIGGLMVALFALRRVSKIAPLRPRFDKQVIGPLLSKGVVYSVVLLTTILMERMEVILLERLSTLDEVGLYSTGMAVSQLTALLPNTLGSALLSHSANAADADAFSQKVGSLVRVTLVFALGSALALIMLAPFLITRIYGNQFVVAADVVVLLAPATVAFTLTRIMYVDMAGRGHPYTVLWGTIPALGLQIIWDFVLIPRYGCLGAAVGSSLGQCTAACIIAIVYCRSINLKPLSFFRFRVDDFEFIERSRRIILGKWSRFAKRAI